MLLTNEEIEAMQGINYFLRTLYIFAIRRYMDYQTGIVGIKRRISYQSLSEEMYIEPEKGFDREETGSPSKPRLQRALKRLQKIGLIVQIKNNDYLIFRCVLARRDNCVQNIPDTNPIHFSDTLPDTSKRPKKLVKARSSASFTSQADTLPDTPKLSLPDTPPLSGKDKEKELLRSSKKKRQMPDDFKVTDQHKGVASKNNWPDPYTEIEAFRDYHLSKASSFADWDRAFYTWLRNSARFIKEKKRANQQSHTKTNKSNSFDRAIENIINSTNRLR